jgi:hypothetical protein
MACIDLTEDSDQEERVGDVRKQLSKPGKSEASGAKGRRAAKKAKVKMEGVTVIDIDAIATSKDDDIEVVDAPADEMVPEEDSKPAARADGDDEVVLVGAANQLRLPHMRQHCTKCIFVVSDTTEAYSKYAATTVEANTKTCDLCYCYVCDCPAKECSEWSSEAGTLSDNHCCASDKHDRWVKLRQQTSKSRNGGVAGLSSPSGSTSQGSSDSSDSEEDHFDSLPRGMLVDFGGGAYNILNGRKGPFAPDDAILKDKRSLVLLTRCRKCYWYSRVTSTSTSAIGSGDWCHKCGVVICEDRFGKQQFSYKKGKDDILLGERIMPFTIVAHNPREFDEFKSYWTDADKSSSERTYDETEMEEDTFRHRLGKRPLLKNVLKCIPIVEKEKMPKTGSVHGFPTGFGHHGSACAAEDTEGIVLESRNDLHVLQMLAINGGFGRIAGWNAGDPIDGDIVASWDKTTHSGVSSCNSHLFAITP